MSYLEKYLKYKNKYLNLLNQIGGAKTCYMCKNLIPDDATECPHCKNKGWTCLTCTFVNLSNREFCAVCNNPNGKGAVRTLQSQRPKLVVHTLCTDNSVRARWRNHLRRNCLSILPQTHGMEVVHYDPHRTISDIESYQNSEASEADDTRFECKVSHEFNRLMLTDLARQPCHLFIDMVPTLVYTNIPKQARDSEGNIYPISSVNIGNVPRLSDALAQCQIFSMNHNMVVTYIDRMITCGYRFDSEAPYQFIFDLYNRFSRFPPEVVLPIIMDLLFTERLNIDDLVKRINKLLQP